MQQNGGGDGVAGGIEPAGKQSQGNVLQKVKKQVSVVAHHSRKQDGAEKGKEKYADKSGNDRR